MNHFPIFSDYQKLIKDNPKGVEKIVGHGRELVDRLLSQGVELLESQSNQARTLFDSVLIPYFTLEEQVAYPWGLVGHLKDVLGEDEIRTFYENNLALISNFFTGNSQDERLYRICEGIKERNFSELNSVEQKIVEDLILDFILSGVLLPEEKKKKFKSLVEEMMQLSNQFSSNVLKDTDEFSWFFPDTQELEKMPEGVLERAHLAAVRENRCSSDEEGYLFNLKPSSYIDFMTYQPRRELREKMSKAYSTRASKGERNNDLIINQLLEKRQQLAELLSFKTYSEVILKKHLVKNASDVFNFLNQLGDRSKTIALEEKKELQQLLEEDYPGVDFETYDLPYYTEKLKQRRYHFNAEEVKQYFPHDHVVRGMFEILEKLFGCSFKESKGVAGWHESTVCYQVFKNLYSQDDQVEKNDQVDQPVGYIYFDLFARQGKNGGAWMDIHQSRKRHHPEMEAEFKSFELFRNSQGLDKKSEQSHTKLTELQLPIAYLVCNFSPPNEDGISFLSHSDVETLFHEMGHVLHHVLTDQEYLPVSGIAKVPWDGVELPSQFLENWAWNWESLQQLSYNPAKGEPIPRDLYEQMWKSRNLNAATKMLFQLEYALFDMELHANYLGHRSAGHSVQDTLNQVRNKHGVYHYPDYHKFQNGFSHIFNGGYASGYYSYKWAEVMAADAFSVFMEQGIFNSELGDRFKNTILAKGGSEDFKNLYIKFKGSEPTVEALLEQRGLSVT